MAKDKEDANQNQYNHKSMAASASAGGHAPDNESLNSPENLGGERPNQSNTNLHNTNSARNETGERLDLKNAEQPNMRDDR